MALSEYFFEPLVAGSQKASLASLFITLPFQGALSGVLLCCSACQAHRAPLLAGVLLCGSVHQALKGALWLGSYAVDQCISHLKGLPGWGPAL